MPENTNRGLVELEYSPSDGEAKAERVAAADLW